MNQEMLEENDLHCDTCVCNEKASVQDLKWKKVNGKYVSKCGKFTLSSVGWSGWYIYQNDGTDTWDIHYAYWTSTLQMAKRIANLLNKEMR